MKKLKLFLFFLLTAFILKAQTSLIGKIRDTDSQIPLESIKLRLSKGGFSFQVQSDENGNYSFFAVNPGAYRLEVNHRKYESLFIDNVLLLENKTVQLNIELLKGGPFLNCNAGRDYRTPLVRYDQCTSGTTFIFDDKKQILRKTE